MPGYNISYYNKPKPTKARKSREDGRAAKGRRNIGREFMRKVDMNLNLL